MVRQPGRSSEFRMGRAIKVPPDVYRRWGEKQTYIAQLELMAVLVAMIVAAPVIRGTRGLWFVDNVAALMALTNGTSREPSLEKMAKVIHLALFALKACAYYEYVESHANWSDQISRQSLEGIWAASNGFAPEWCPACEEFWSLPTVAIVKVFQFL